MRPIDRSNRHVAAASFSPTMQSSTAYQQELAQRNFWQANANVAKRRRAPPLYGNVEHDSIYLNDRRHSLGTPQLDGDEFPVYSKFIYPVAAANAATYAYLRESGNRSNESLNAEFEIDDAAAVGMEMLSRNGQHIYYGEDADPHVLNTEKVVRNLTAFGRFLEILQKWPLPRLSLTTACICFLLAIIISPRTCVQSILFPAFRLSFGTLYPAYASYKAVRTKNVKEYVKWMMYWIVYAFFTCIETFTDIFLSWFPFYYEVKVLIVLWLLSPATKGSSTLYRKFVHPMLTRREQEIDEYLNQAKERGYSAVLQLGSKGVNYATNVIMQTALKGGGNLVQTLRRSYSLSDLSEPDVHRTQDEVDAVAIRPQQRMLRPRMQTAVGRSASGTRHSTGMYFTEVDVTGKGAADFNYNIRSSEDISSGYSSAEPGLSRTSSMTNASKARLKVKRSEIIDWEPQTTPLERKHAPTRYVPAPVLNDWKEDAFMDNELYFRGTYPANFKTEQETSKIPRSNISIDTLESSTEESRNSSVTNIFESRNKNVETSLNLKTIMMPPHTVQLHVENNLNETETEKDKIIETEQKTREVPRSNIAIDTLESPREESRNSSLIDIVESRNKNVESSLDLNTIMTSPYTDQLHAENDLKEIESEEDENFEDAISVVDTVDNLSFYANETIKDQINLSKSYGVSSNEETSIVSPEDLQETLKEKGKKEIIVDESSNDEKPTVSPKGLRDTLQEIKNSFRATIEASPTPSLQMLEKHEIELEKQQNDNNIPRRTLKHNKGKAPPPPPRPSRPSIPPRSSSSSSLHSSADNTDTASISSIFKNLKTNIFHSSKNNATSEPEKRRKSILIETEI